jgi:flagellar FliJ protein
LARRFIFRLEKVLDLRRQKEQEAMRELAHAKEILARERRILEDLLHKRRCGQQELIAKQRGNLDPNEVLNYLQYLDKLSEFIEHQTLRVHEAERLVEEARERLLQASKEKKIVEKLRENQFKKYKEELMKAELNFLDEVGTLRYTREIPPKKGA